MPLPRVAPVIQVLQQPTITDVYGTVRERWLASRLRGMIRTGDSVAVGVGSRGINGIAEITRATLDVLRNWGAKPFVVAAMGSHGGGTSEGQRELLAGYGVCEEKLGVPVKTDMDTVVLGKNSWGDPVHWDQNAFQADHVITLSRIKAHTDFRGKHESGIVKMLGIGLGKRTGAAQHHRWGVRGLRDMLPESAKVVIEKTPFRAGLAIIENAKEQTALLEVLHRDEVFEKESALLIRSRELMGKLPFHQMDLLIIGEIGKNYSGAGIDPNVVGRLLMEGEPEFESPRITRICALELSPESHGNGTGIGIADLTTDRLLASIDQVPFRMNNLTACFLWRSKLPFAFPNDKACLEAGVATCWQPEFEKLRMAIIPNTLELAELWVSPALLAEAKTSNKLEVRGDLEELTFDAQENLVQKKLFPHSVRSRRA